MFARRDIRSLLAQHRQRAAQDRARVLRVDNVIDETAFRGVERVHELFGVFRYQPGAKVVRVVG